MESRRRRPPPSRSPRPFIGSSSRNLGLPGLYPRNFVGARVTPAYRRRELAYTSGEGPNDFGCATPPAPRHVGVPSRSIIFSSSRATSRGQGESTDKIKCEPQTLLRSSFAHRRSPPCCSTASVTASRLLELFAVASRSRIGSRVSTAVSSSRPTRSCRNRHGPHPPPVHRRQEPSRSKSSGSWETSGSTSPGETHGTQSRK
jgi:hypothetical protein